MSPIKCFKRTLLPVPEGPTITSDSPGATEKETPSNTTFGPKDLWRSRASSFGADSGSAWPRAVTSVGLRLPLIIHEHLRPPLRSFPPNASSALLDDASDIAVVALPRLDEKSRSRTIFIWQNSFDAYTSLP